jgi:hypothetical protein
VLMVTEDLLIASTIYDPLQLNSLIFTSYILKNKQKAFLFDIKTNLILRQWGQSNNTYTI